MTYADPLVITIGITIAGWLVTRWLRRPLPARTLADAKLSYYFRGLSIGGLDRSYVLMQSKKSKHRFHFEKHCGASDNWTYHITLQTDTLPHDVVSSIHKEVRALSGILKLEKEVEVQLNGAIELSMSGIGLKDPQVLEELTRKLAVCIGAPADAKYQITMRGPIDPQAIDDYLRRVLKEAYQTRKQNRGNRSGV